MGDYPSLAGFLAIVGLLNSGILNPFSLAQSAAALAGLDAARSEGMVALADIDAIYAAGRIEGAPASEAKAARDAANALVTAQDRVIAQLQSQLAP